VTVSPPSDSKDQIHVNASLSPELSVEVVMASVAGCSAHQLAAKYRIKGCQVVAQLTPHTLASKHKPMQTHTHARTHTHASIGHTPGVFQTYMGKYTTATTATDGHPSASYAHTGVAHAHAPVVVRVRESFKLGYTSGTFVISLQQLVAEFPAGLERVDALISVLLVDDEDVLWHTGPIIRKKLVLSKGH
ncbi:hypothetical protein SARC_07290, partial [Sphaeroforma arctica JP610]